MRKSSLLVVVAVAILASGCTAWTWGNRYVDGPSTPTEATVGWRSTATSAFHTCRLDLDRRLWCHGENRFGEVGDGTGIETTDFVRIGNDTWVDVDTSSASTCGVKSDRTLWCWGVFNDATYPPEPGDLVLAPEQIGSAGDWATVDGSLEHWCAIKVDGALWCWGKNPNYQLGDGTREYRDAPVLISTAEWTSVGGGYSVTCGTQADHTLWCWGVDLVGESGQGVSAHGNTEYPTPTQVGVAANWRAVSLADSYACATKLDGTLWCWGAYGASDNTYIRFADVPTQLGTADTWRTVDTGDHVACGIQTDNTMWCWGKNIRGRVGDGTTEDRHEPVQVGAGQIWIDVSVFWTVDALAWDPS